MPKNKSGVFMMMKEKIISNILVKSGAYKDLESPVILASGELGIYFVNTQFVLGDRDVDKRVDEFGDDSAALDGHTNQHHYILCRISLSWLAAHPIHNLG